MTQWERMEAGLIYDPADPDIMKVQSSCLDRLYDFNHTRPSQGEERVALLKEMFAEIGRSCWIEPPFRANWAGYFVHIGDYFYANAGLTLVDDGPIYIGNKVMFGPNVTIATANHPIEAELRAVGLQYNKPVRIGDNAWLGAGVTVVPGVTIGENAVIGAGSVVTRDIPANTVAVGNPCRVIRQVSDRDCEFFYKNEAIDWDQVAPIARHVAEDRAKSEAAE